MSSSQDVETTSQMCAGGGAGKEAHPERNRSGEDGARVRRLAPLVAGRGSARALRPGRQPAPAAGLHRDLYGSPSPAGTVRPPSQPASQDGGPSGSHEALEPTWLTRQRILLRKASHVTPILPWVVGQFGDSELRGIPSSALSQTDAREVLKGEYAVALLVICLFLGCEPYLRRPWAALSAASYRAPRRIADRGLGDHVLITPALRETVPVTSS